MTAKNLSNALGNISERYIEEAITYKAERKSSTRIRWMSAAACICLVFTAMICIFAMNNRGKIIANYGKTDYADLYAVPENGEYGFYVELSEALKAYEGKDVEFLVAFSVTHLYEGVPGFDEISGEELNAEYQRLADLGYKLYYVEDHWTYREKGEKVYQPIVVGLFTAEQLKNFKANEKYGYLFRFEHNGDGSPISVKDIDINNAILDFDSDYIC